MTDDRLRAELHPRGALGWRSFVRVSDGMHTDDAVPVVAADALLKDVVGIDDDRAPRHGDGRRPRWSRTPST